jgi:hypothetical protein
VEQHIGPALQRSGAALSLNACRCQKHKSGVTASQLTAYITRMTEKCQTPAVYNSRGCVCGTRAHVDEVMQGRWGLAAAALEHQQQHKRATPRAAPPTECRSTRAAGAGLNSLRTRPVLPQTSRYYLAESERVSRHAFFPLGSPSAAPARTRRPCKSHHPLPAAYLYRRLRVCESAASGRRRTALYARRCQGSQSLSLIRDISHQESERERGRPNCFDPQKRLADREFGPLFRLSPLPGKVYHPFVEE